MFLDPFHGENVLCMLHPRQTFARSLKDALIALGGNNSELEMTVSSISKTVNRQL